MDYTYKLLTDDEKDEIMAAFIHAQERDLYCHTLGLERYNEILKNVAEGPWKKRIQALQREVILRLAEVESIITATTPQLPSSERLAAAKDRLAAKNAAVKA
jgi:hypothetical protein